MVATVLALCLVAAQTAPEHAIPAGENVVFVGVLPQTDVDPSTARSISELLTTVLHRYASVISDSDVKALLDNMSNREILSCVDETCFAEMGMALGAGYLISGTVGMVGDRAVLTLTLINTTKVETVSRASATASSVGDLVGKEEQIIRELLRIDPPTPTAMARPSAHRPWLSPIRIGVGGASVLCLASGVVLGVLAGKRAEDVRSLGTPTAAELSAYQSAQDEAENLALGADISFGVALVGVAILAVDLFLLDDDTNPVSNAMVPNSIGLAWSF